MRKKLVLCSGKTSKSLLIISSVHSNRASRIGGMSSVASDWGEGGREGEGWEEVTHTNYGSVSGVTIMQLV